MKINRRKITVTKQQKIVSYVPHDFSKIYWPRIVMCNPNRDYCYILGGIRISDNKVSAQNLEVNLKNQKAIVRAQMPEPKYCHGAIMVKDSIYVTGGIEEMMHPMGMRCVPIGSKSCFRYNTMTASWREMPQVPVGKMYPTLISIENRYIFQIGGFDDFDFDIYCLDTHNIDAQWSIIKLSDEIQILKNIPEVSSDGSEIGIN